MLHGFSHGGHKFRPVFDSRTNGSIQVSATQGEKKIRIQVSESDIITLNLLEYYI